MLGKALLLATLTISGSGDPQINTTSTLLGTSLVCPEAMQQVVDHHHLTNNVYSKGQGYIKARKAVPPGATVNLTVTCKEL